MKKEDFESEVNALFEEDSILAQAVIDLQERRKSAEAAKKEAEEKAARIAAEEEAAREAEEASSHESGNTSGNTDGSLLNDDNALTVTENSDAESGTEIRSNGADTLAPEADENLPLDSSGNNTEADAAADDKKSSDNSKKDEPKPKKKRKKSAKADDTQSPRRRGTPIATTVELLDFVSGENTVRPDKESALFDLGFSFVGKKEDQSPAEEAEAEVNASGTDEPADIPEEQTREEADENEVFADNGDTTHATPAEHTEPIFIPLYEGITPELGGYGDSSVFIDAEALSIPDLDSGLTSDMESGPDSEDAENNDSEENGDTEQSDSDAPQDAADYATDDVTPDKVKKPAEKSRFIDGVFDFLELFIFSLAAVLLITTFFFRHSVVEGGSMEQTLFDGEHIIISKLFYEPERGDIIVCEDYSLDNEYYRKPLVKRIIGIPGDTVMIIYNRTEKRSSVYVNGEKLDEDYVYIDSFPDYRNDSGIWTVGEGEVFVMGDHRNNSSDSRDIGCIRIDSIIGKALIRFYPFDKFGKIE